MSIIRLLELMGRESPANAAGNERVLGGLLEETEHVFKSTGPDALSAALGTRIHLTCYVTAPDNEPSPADAPDELPEDPEQQESAAA